MYKAYRLDKELSEQVLRHKEQGKIFLEYLNDYVPIQSCNRVSYLLLSDKPVISGRIPFGFEYSGILTKTEETMFNSMIIKDIQLGEVDRVAMEKSLERIANDNPDIEFVSRGDSAYLVRNGKSLKIDSDELSNRFKDEIVGKTVSQFKNMRLLYNILSELNLIKSLTLESDQKDVLSTIFK
jgi:hypothetical protein